MVDDVEQTVGIQVEEFGGVVAATCSSWSTQVMLVGTSMESIRRSPESLAAGFWLTQTKQRRRGARSCSLGLALVLLQHTHCPSVEENGFPPCCIRARGSSPHRLSLGGPEPSSRQARAASGSRWSRTWGHPRARPCHLSTQHGQSTQLGRTSPGASALRPATLWGGCAQKRGSEHPFTTGAVTEEQDLP